MHRAGAWGRALAAVSAAAIAALTLYPLPHAAAAAARTPLLCLVCGERGGVDVILNVFLFMPLGFGLRLAGGRIRHAVLASALLSFTVELLQYTVIPGRDASLSDLLTNTGGGLLGALLVNRLPLLLRPSPRAGMRLLLAGALGWLGLVAVSGWLLLPDFGDADLEAAAATIPAPEVFTGRVLEVRRAGEVQPQVGPPPDSAALRQALRRGQVGLEARVTTGATSKGRRWLYMIGEKGVPRLDLSEDDRDVVFGVPARAQAFLLGTPSVLLPDGLPPDSGRTAVLTAEERDRVLRLTSTYEGSTRSAALTLSPMLGWTLIAPFDLGVGPRVPLVTGLLLVLLVLPLGYWARRTGRRPAALGVLTAAVVIGLGVIPRLQGFPPVSWVEWIAALAGIAAGWALPPAAAYLQRRCGSPSTAESSSF